MINPTPPFEIAILIAIAFWIILVAIIEGIRAVVRFLKRDEKGANKGPKYGNS